MRLRVATAAVLAAVAVSSSASASSGGSRPPCPKTFPGGLARSSPAQVRQAEHGVFSIAGIRARLRIPIDWAGKRFHSPVAERALNDLVWMSPLDYAYLHSGSRRALREAVRILLDFTRQHPRVKPGNRTVWERKRAADRVMQLVFVVRAAGCEGLLRAPQRAQLLRAVRRHARFLYATPNTPLRTNHDLVQDLGLMSVRDYLPTVRAARRWYRAGDRRFVSGIRELVDPRTGVHLEHTASYQFLTVDRLAEYVRLARPPAAGMRTLLAKMRRVASWFVMPDGSTVPFGDTPFGDPAPGYAARAAPHDRGLAPTLRSGYAIARRDGSYLATTAGYHRSAHKQADELSFDLFEHGHRVIVDSGRVNAGRGPKGAKRFSLSAQAHSTLVVDGRSFPLNGDFYGSALDAQGVGDGWYAVEGHNPLLAPQHVSQHRLFLYRPGVALVVIDSVRSRISHTYERFLQVAPELSATVGGDQGTLEDGRFRATVWGSSGRAPLGMKVLRGKLHPLRGWYAPPGISRLRPRDTLRLRSRGRSTTLVMTIALSSQPAFATPTANGAAIVLGPGSAENVTVRRQGRRLRVDAQPAASSPAAVARWLAGMARACAALRGAA
jgi:hypothetical protein